VRRPDAAKGTLKLPLSGDRARPDAISVRLAHQLCARLPELLSQRQTSLFEHYLPYRDAAYTGALPDERKRLPEITSPAGVWPSVSPAHILIEPMDGIPTIEIAFAVAWDEEHTVGARIRDWRLIELCGSV